MPSKDTTATASATSTESTLLSRKTVIGERPAPVTSFADVDHEKNKEPPASVRYLGPVPGIEVNVNNLRWGGVDAANHAKGHVERKFWSVQEAKSFEGVTLGDLGVNEGRKDASEPAFEVTVGSKPAKTSKVNA